MEASFRCGVRPVAAPERLGLSPYTGPLAANALGLGSIMGIVLIFAPGGTFAKAIGLPEHIVPLATLPIGYPARKLGRPRPSRTTWIIEHDGKAYTPSGYMTTWWGKLWKHWPIEAEQDGRILLRIGDKLYERRLIRIESGPLLGPLTAELSRKYAGDRG
jgi:hypothetical protein